MSPRIMVTEADLLEALVTASTAPEDARTVQELMAETGLSKFRVRAALIALKAAGRLRAHQVTREALDGRQRVAPAYTILPKARPKKKAG